MAAALALPAGIADAKPSLKLKADVGSVEKLGSCAGGGQAYRVTAVVTVDNKTAQAAVLATTDLDSTYKDGSGKHTQGTVGISSDGGFRPGQGIAAGAKRDLTVVSQLTLPCSELRWADLVVKATFTGREPTFTARDKFLTGTTSIPAGGLGGVLLALLIGAGGMLLLQVRRTGPRRPID